MLLETIGAFVQMKSLQTLKEPDGKLITVDLMTAFQK